MDTQKSWSRRCRLLLYLYGLDVGVKVYPEVVDYTKKVTTKVTGRMAESQALESILKDLTNCTSDLRATYFRYREKQILGLYSEFHRAVVVKKLSLALCRIDQGKLSNLT